MSESVPPAILLTRVLKNVLAHAPHPQSQVFTLILQQRNALKIAQTLSTLMEARKPVLQNARKSGTSATRQTINASRFAHLIYLLNQIGINFLAIKKINFFHILLFKNSSLCVPVCPAHYQPDNSTRRCIIGCPAN